LLKAVFPFFNVEVDFAKVLQDYDLLLGPQNLTLLGEIVHLLYGIRMTLKPHVESCFQEVRRSPLRIHWLAKNIWASV
jgi:hypothetical protein